MIGQMTIALALPGFNDLGHLVTPFLMAPFLYRFPKFSEKNKENLSIISLKFLQNAPSVLFSY